MVTETLPPVHAISEDNPWSVYIRDHPSRRESRWFRHAKQTTHRILATLDADTYPYGPGPWELHHAGSIWVRGARTWLLVRARVGIEWSVQFCADPAKVERLRREAEEVVDAFPATVPALRDLGYADVDEVLREPIVDAAGVQRWTDGLFNSCVPLTHADHQGILPGAAGEHHYPWPIKAADFVRRDDFVLWVTLPGGHSHAAVLPVAPRGSGEGAVRLAYARHGTQAAEALTRAAAEDLSVILPDSHPLARRAFAAQYAADDRRHRTAS